VTVLQVVWGETSPLRDAREHARAYFFLVMEREYDIRPTFAPENPVRRAGLSFDRPTDAK
jgi:hypothetical protein